jgi:hypothetical protein
VHRLQIKPPIRNLHAIDILGHRMDGGVDMAIVCCGPLDDSIRTILLLERKVSAYLNEIQLPSFRKEFGDPGSIKVRVLIYCQYAISAAMEAMIKVLAGRASSVGVELLLDRSPVEA